MQYDIDQDGSATTRLIRLSAPRSSRHRRAVPVHLLLTEISGYPVASSCDDNGAWLAQTAPIPAAHTYGGTTEEARANIRETIGAHFDIEPETINLAETITEQ